MAKMVAGMRRGKMMQTIDDYKQVIKEIRALVYKAHHHCMEHSDMEFHASCIKILTYSILRKIDEMGEI